MAQHTLYATVTTSRHEEMCTTCWTCAIVTISTSVLRDNGVDTRDRTLCLRCRRDNEIG